MWNDSSHRHDPRFLRPHFFRDDISGSAKRNACKCSSNKFGRLAYCTDVSRIPEESYPLLEGLDVLVLDALQYKRHSTHFSVEQATAEAQRIGAKQTWFTHIAHALHHATANAALPPGVQLAYDGLRVAAGW